eukprot:1785850-Ditylum_brightwellii.AAC.1
MATAAFTMSMLQSIQAAQQGISLCHHSIHLVILHNLTFDVPTLPNILLYECLAFVVLHKSQTILAKEMRDCHAKAVKANMIHHPQNTLGWRK